MPGLGVTGILDASTTAAAKVLSFQTNASANSTTNFTNLAIGTAAADRRVIAVYGWQVGGGTLTTATIGGVAATVVGSINNSGGHGAILIALVTSGTTATISMTQSGGAVNSSQVGVWSCTGLSADAALAIGTTSTNSGTITLTTVNGGFVVGGGGSSNNTANNWTVATSRFDSTSNSNFRFSGADVNTTASSTPVTRGGGATEPVTIAASW